MKSKKVTPNIKYITHAKLEKEVIPYKSKSRKKPILLRVKDNSYLSYEKKDDRTSLEGRSYLWDHITFKNLRKQKSSDKSKYINDCKTIKKFTKINKEFQSGTSKITFLVNSFNEMIVRKEFVYYKNPRRRPFNPTESYQNELNALKLLKDCKHFPQLLYHNDDECSIYMTYCGEHININNTPPDWKEQMISIYNTLKEKNIYNNDVYIHNFCIKDDIISLIDFGLAKQHIDFCFYNLTLEDINKATNIDNLNQLIQERAKPIYSTLYYCY